MDGQTAKHRLPILLTTANTHLLRNLIAHCTGAAREGKIWQNPNLRCVIGDYLIFQV